MTPRMARLSLYPATLVLVAVLWLVPETASACTVCMGGQEEESRIAFIGTTAMMTFLPLTVLGFVITWFVRRTLERERQDAEAAQNPRG